jgi:hypothetical protein
MTGPDRPTTAGLYDYFLGGRNGRPADRAAAEKLQAAVPEIADAVRANRAFHGRAVRWMAGQGIGQFIDIGSGLPTQHNTHQVAHEVTPEAKVVYVDNDPVVAAQAGPLLAGDGTTTVITADMRDPAALLGQPALCSLIDFTAPAGVLMSAVVHFVADEDDPWSLVARYMAAVAPGSYLALSHGTYDEMHTGKLQASRDVYENSASGVHLRSRAEVERFFDGLDLVPHRPGAVPALTYVSRWGVPNQEVTDSEGARGVYCGVARRP